jgi:hypothetical protein
MIPFEPNPTIDCIKFVQAVDIKDRTFLLNFYGYAVVSKTRLHTEIRPFCTWANKKSVRCAKGANPHNKAHKWLQFDLVVGLLIG